MGLRRHRRVPPCRDRPAAAPAAAGRSVRRLRGDEPAPASLAARSLALPARRPLGTARQCCPTCASTSRRWICIRIEDPVSIARLRAEHGCSVLDPESRALAAFLSAHPHRVAPSLIGYLDVHQRICGSDSRLTGILIDCGPTSSRAMTAPTCCSISIRPVGAAKMTTARRCAAAPISSVCSHAIHRTFSRRILGSGRSESPLSGSKSVSPATGAGKAQ